MSQLMTMQPTRVAGAEQWYLHKNKGRCSAATGPVTTDDNAVPMHATADDHAAQTHGRHRASILYDETCMVVSNRSLCNPCTQRLLSNQSKTKIKKGHNQTTPDRCESVFCFRPQKNFRIIYADTQRLAALMLADMH
eukprot:scaffold264252_cov21-Tisochrysis_lutea.AAC.1